MVVGVSLAVALRSDCSSMASATASAVAKRVASARHRIFGTISGGGVRSGRKALRKPLAGPSIDSWYPYTMKELAPPA